LLYARLRKVLGPNLQKCKLGNGLIFELGIGLRHVCGAFAIFTQDSWPAECLQLFTRSS
jgi:hypothetical protein